MTVAGVFFIGWVIGSAIGWTLFLALAIGRITSSARRSGGLW